MFEGQSSDLLWPLKHNTSNATFWIKKYFINEASATSGGAQYMQKITFVFTNLLVLENSCPKGFDTL